MRQWLLEASTFVNMASRGLRQCRSSCANEDVGHRTAILIYRHWRCSYRPLSARRDKAGVRPFVKDTIVATVCPGGVL